MHDAAKKHMQLGPLLPGGRCRAARSSAPWAGGPSLAPRTVRSMRAHTAPASSRLHSVSTSLIAGPIVMQTAGVRRHELGG